MGRKDRFNLGETFDTGLGATLGLEACALEVLELLPEVAEAVDLVGIFLAGEELKVDMELLAWDTKLSHGK
jgi:hypothetical protein